MLSPGALGSAHQSQEGNCDACHLSFAGIPNDKCLGCHEGLAKRISAGKGFHATVKAQECIACHGDHVGEDGSLTKAEAKKAFDHSKTGFSLVGSHADVKCATCHEKPIHEMKAVCGQCHEDAHSSALGPQCNACHEPIAWDSGIRALNAHLLSMEGKHGQQECSGCHLHGANLEGDAACSDCHEDTHGGTVAPCEDCHEVTGFKPAEFDHGPCTCAFPGKHQTVECLACHEGFKFTDTPTLCSGCHDDERPHDPIGECSRCHTATSWVDNRFDHNKQAKFQIVGAHESVSCTQCHADGTFRGAPLVCEGCHEETGLKAHGDFSSFGGCASCHVVAGFTPSTFDHASTGFSLDGRHGTLSCQDCHAKKVEGYPAD
ncbi:MAG: hypothetical protein H6737_18580 [Alphaproteobacteria bacterium]|nr:hypothetical protein [Alphaproteobacteria bacterium]